MKNLLEGEANIKSFLLVVNGKHRKMRTFQPEQEESVIIRSLDTIISRTQRASDTIQVTVTVPVLCTRSFTFRVSRVHES